MVRVAAQIQQRPAERAKPARPSPRPSPRGEGGAGTSVESTDASVSIAAAFVFVAGEQWNTGDLRFAHRRLTFHPLLGERAGVRGGQHLLATCFALSLATPLKRSVDLRLLPIRACKNGFSACRGVWQHPQDA